MIEGKKAREAFDYLRLRLHGCRNDECVVCEEIAANIEVVETSLDDASSLKAEVKRLRAIIRVALEEEPITMGWAEKAREALDNEDGDRMLEEAFDGFLDAWDMGTPEEAEKAEERFRAMIV